jgi:integrase
MGSRWFFSRETEDKRKVSWPPVYALEGKIRRASGNCPTFAKPGRKGEPPDRENYHRAQHRIAVVLTEGHWLLLGAQLIERRRTARRIEKKGLVTLSEFVFHNGGQMTEKAGLVVRPVGEFRKAWATACVTAGVGSLLCPKCYGHVDAKFHCEKCEQDWTREQLCYRGRIVHDLRRCAARSLLAAGVPQAVAMKITGHKTDSMFRRYAIVTVEQQREALRMAEVYRRHQAQEPKTVRIN